MGQLNAEDKIAAKISDSAIIEFFPDVTAEKVQEILRQVNCQVHKMPSFPVNVVAVDVSEEQINKLADFDEVSLISQAPNTLKSGKILY